MPRFRDTPDEQGRTVWRTPGMQMMDRYEEARGVSSVPMPRPWGVHADFGARGEPLWFSWPWPSGWKIVLGDLLSKVTKDWVHRYTLLVAERTV
jgi:hypothetical protein